MSDEFKIDQVDQLNTNPNNPIYNKNVIENYGILVNKAKDEIKKSNNILAWVSGLSSGIISGVISGVIVYYITK